MISTRGEDEKKVRQGEKRRELLLGRSFSDISSKIEGGQRGDSEGEGR